MNSATIIEEALADGLRLELTPAGTIEAVGDAATIERWLPVLRARKADLVQALQAEAVLPAPAACAIEDTEALVAGADLACWPHSSAMNSQEIGTFIERERLFHARGLTAEIAEALADKLVQRDRAADDRRLCLECRHLQGGIGRWRCVNWQRAEVPHALARDLVFMPQRCAGFYSQTPTSNP